MLIKTVLCVTLLIFTSGIGYSFALKYRKRKLFYSQFYEFNEKFLQELGYTKRPLAEFIKNTAYKGDFSELLRLFLEGSFKETNFESYFSSITFLKNEEDELSLFNEVKLLFIKIKEKEFLKKRSANLDELHKKWR